MNGKQIRAALHAGRPVYSTAAVAPSSRWPGLLQQAGIDFVFIDTEHVPLGRETLSWMCQAYAAMGVPPVVRIPSPDPFEACKVLDGGAGGVIGPYVETAEQVRGLVGALPPQPTLLGDSRNGGQTGEPDIV